MKHIPYLLIPLLLATLACAVAPQNGGTSDNRPALSEARPALVIIAPQAGQRYALGAELRLYAEAQDPQGGITRIEFYDNFDELIGTINASSPGGERSLSGEVRWLPPNAQRHFIRARAFRADDTASNLQEVSIEVVPLAGFQAPPSEDETSQTEPEAETEPEAQSAPTSPEDSAAQAPPPPDTGPETAPSQRLNAVVLLEAVNVRVAPRIDALLAAPALSNGTAIELLGRNEDGQWYAIQLPSGSIAWVYGGSAVVPALQIDGDPASLPLVSTQ